jgi:hypothetical protein
MTGDEFMAKQAVAKQKLDNFPADKLLGICLSLIMGMVVCSFLLIIDMLQYKDGPRYPYYYELAFCVIVEVLSWPAAGILMRKIRKWGVFCPSCHHHICDDRSVAIALETGNCRHCGKRVIAP